MVSFETTANIRKTQDKYCLLSFMHRNLFLAALAKINKCGGLNKVREGENKSKS